MPCFFYKHKLTAQVYFYYVLCSDRFDFVLSSFELSIELILFYSCSVVKLSLHSQRGMSLYFRMYTLHLTKDTSQRDAMHSLPFIVNSKLIVHILHCKCSFRSSSDTNSVGRRRETERDRDRRRDKVFFEEKKLRCA